MNPFLQWILQALMVISGGVGIAGGVMLLSALLNLVGLDFRLLRLVFEVAGVDPNTKLTVGLGLFVVCGGLSLTLVLFLDRLE